jgi:hypothetical protein
MFLNNSPKQYTVLFLEPDMGLEFDVLPTELQGQYKVRGWELTSCVNFLLIYFNVIQKADEIKETRFAETRDLQISSV